MNDGNFIEIFKKELGYFKEKKYRNLANEIIYFYEEAKEINLSSFISFISTKDYIYDDAMEIIRKIANIFRPRIGNLNTIERTASSLIEKHFQN